MVKIGPAASAASHDQHVTSASASDDVMLLPLHTTLPDGRDVSISAISDHQLSDVYLMIQEAARNSEGFGWDEFPTEADFRRDMHGGKNLQICLQEPCKRIAVLLITPSKFYRGRPLVADPWLIVNAEERRKGVGEFCFGLGMEYSRRVGYHAMYADTFTNNVAMRKILERFGFQRVGLLPMGATLRDGTVVGTAVYYKDLRQLDTERGQGEGQCVNNSVNQHVHNSVNSQQHVHNNASQRQHMENSVSPSQYVDNGMNLNHNLHQDLCQHEHVENAIKCG